MASKITVEQARNTIIDAFKSNPDFRTVYVDNVACVIMDNIPGYRTKKEERDAVADKIIKHLFV